MSAENLKPQLLVVEDDYENQKLLEIFLRKRFDISICDSEKSFYEKLNYRDFDIFLMDISLKGEKNGLELIRELRQTEKYKDAPVVCISAHVFPKDRDNAFNSGADEFLTRPVNNGELLSSLLNVYKRKTGIEI